MREPNLDNVEVVMQLELDQPRALMLHLITKDLRSRLVDTQTDTSELQNATFMLTLSTLVTELEAIRHMLETASNVNKMTIS